MSNDEDPAQPGGNAEETTYNDFVNYLWEPHTHASFDQAQQDPDTSPPAGPSVENFENSQIQQAQTNAESTNFLSLENVQAQNPPGNIDQGETLPIPSVIDLIQGPGNRPYEFERGPKDCIWPSNDPSKDLLLRNAKVRRQIQRGQNSSNNSNPGETRPIPSIMGMDRGPSDGPYDPH